MPQVRDSVRDMYRKYPYPRVDTDIKPVLEGKKGEPSFPREFFHVYWPDKKPVKKLDILIAGCGTSQPTRWAVAHPEATITAIDLSAESLRLAQSGLDHYDCKNTTLKEMAIEDVKDLGQEFDLVVSTGVIHHCESPELALQCLRDVLTPEGSMYLMVYGTYGRDGIHYVQEFLRMLDVSWDSDADTFLNVLWNLPACHPVAHRLSMFADLRKGLTKKDKNQLGALVDYFLHPREKTYTLPEILDLLWDNHLLDQYFPYRAHYSPRASGLRASPLFSEILKWPDNIQLTIGELYRACVATHHVVVCKDTRKTRYSAWPTDPDWLDLVPVVCSGVKTETTNMAHRWKAYRLGYHHFVDNEAYLNEAQHAVLSRIDGKRCSRDYLKLLEAGPRDTEGWLHELWQDLFAFDLIYFKTQNAL